ncbi:hypothetical protein [Sphingobium quisquiliarum]|uniref:hypothetical protein n=1 Tax=Sphingobium quisquiliarum TaxID=538379 RepID=UPI001F1F3965|nr:hypothetical protein [Sphingobium quisquiliarum]
MPKTIRHDGAKSICAKRSVVEARTVSFGRLHEQSRETVALARAAQIDLTGNVGRKAIGDDGRAKDADSRLHDLPAAHERPQSGKLIEQRSVRDRKKAPGQHDQPPRDRQENIVPVLEMQVKIAFADMRPADDHVDGRPIEPFL